jgi:hypothetical protein
MNTENVQQSTSRIVLDLKWKETETSKLGTSRLRVFQLGEEPEICYIFKSGYSNPQMYHVVFEDGYESPIITHFWTAREIKEHLSIDI